MSKLIEHAVRELRLLGITINLGTDDQYHVDTIEGGSASFMAQNVLSLLYLFADQGHSGMSAAWTLDAFNILADFNVITSLTGADDEWEAPHLSMGGSLQNIRCSRVFKAGDYAYDTEAISFVDVDGHGFSTYESHQPITFPYSPSTRKVHVSQIYVAARGKENYRRLPTREQMKDVKQWEFGR